MGMDGLSRIDELIKKNTKSRAAKSSKGGNDIAMGHLGKPTLPQVDIIESAPAPAVPPPRNPYSNGGYGQPQQDFDYSYNTQPSGGYNPGPQQTGYTQNYGNNNNYQQQQSSRGGGSKKDGGFDPYAESAFTTEEVYDQYSGSQDQLHAQKSRDKYYNNNAQTPRGGGNSGGGGGKYDDYSHLRSASPLPSQHGSDLDSNHYSNHSGGYGHGGSGYNHNNSAPQRPRRNDQGSNYRNY